MSVYLRICENMIGKYKARYSFSVVNQLDSFVPSVGVPGTPQPPLTNFRSPPKSNLKRRLIDCMDEAPSPKRSNTEESMKKKRNIQFDAVTVYYFPRAQGFTCVPSQVHILYNTDFISS